MSSPPGTNLAAQQSSDSLCFVWQMRKMVYQKHEQTGISLEKAVDELQKDFEHAMETVVRCPAEWSLALSRWIVIRCFSTASGLCNVFFC